MNHDISQQSRGSIISFHFVAIFKIPENVRFSNHSSLTVDIFCFTGNQLNVADTNLMPRLALATSLLFGFLCTSAGLTSPRNLLEMWNLRPDFGPTQSKSSFLTRSQSDSHAHSILRGTTLETISTVVGEINYLNSPGVHCHSPLNSIIASFLTPQVYNFI